MVRVRGWEKQPKGHRASPPSRSAALVPPTSTSWVSYKTPHPRAEAPLSPLHPHTTSTYYICRVDNHSHNPPLLTLDSHNFTTSGDSHDNSLLLLPPSSCLRHWANSYVKTWLINTTGYNSLFACSKMGFLNGTGTYVAMFKNLSSSHSLLVLTMHFIADGILKEMNA